MTPEEIIAMAKEAGLLPDNSHPAPETRAMRQRANAVQRFAALAAAKEREACALVAEDEDHEVSVSGYYAQLGDARATMRNIAAAIRARSAA